MTELGKDLFFYSFLEAAIPKQNLIGESFFFFLLFLFVKEGFSRGNGKRRDEEDGGEAG